MDSRSNQTLPVEYYILYLLKSEGSSLSSISVHCSLFFSSKEGLCLIGLEVFGNNLILYENGRICPQCDCNGVAWP